MAGEHPVARSSAEDSPEAARISAAANEDRLGNKPAKLYSAPRRFDLYTLLVVMAAFSLLLGCLSGIGAPPAFSLVLAIFVVLVGLGQALLLGGRRPRLASMLVGLVCFALPFFVFALAAASSAGDIPAFFVIAALLQTLIFGPLFGYIAGALIGGVFLLAEVFRRCLASKRARNGDNSEQDESAQAAP
jgi:hypothetical protein